MVWDCIRIARRAQHNTHLTGWGTALGMVDNISYHLMAAQAALLRRVLTRFHFVSLAWITRYFPGRLSTNSTGALDQPHCGIPVKASHRYHEDWSTFPNFIPLPPLLSWFLSWTNRRRSSGTNAELENHPRHLFQPSVSQGSGGSSSSMRPRGCSSAEPRAVSRLYKRQQQQQQQQQQQKSREVVGR
ncbi:hypothetical protein BKA81DRAFT_343273 [Phyllosticta paracitricarpa]